jgi:hypothetical protein
MSAPPEGLHAGVIRDGKSVLEAEREYLAARRRLARLGEPTSAKGRPIGLALSGGGIRSATFNLGVLQALSSLCILPRFDYLSTVSGGGYIGSCLSSLLSRRKKEPGEREARGGGPLGRRARDEANAAYGIDPETQSANFGTMPATFPFNAQADEQEGLGAFNGRTQVRHLRTHGDFIIARKQLFSRDMLRAVGSVLGGLFYHLLMFLLFLVGGAAIYFAIVCWMVGDIRQEVVPFTFGVYVERLIDWPGADGPRGHPVAWAFLWGALLTLLSLLGTGIALRRLPDRRFSVDGRSVEDQREITSLWVQFAVTAITAMIVTWCFVAGAKGHVRLVFLMLPLGVYIGGQAVALFFHAMVAMLSRAGRNDRSRFAAVKGILNYLTAASFLVVLLPYFIYLLPDMQMGLPAGGGWLASLLGMSLLARRSPRGATGRAVPGAGAASAAAGTSDAASGVASVATGWINKLFRLSTSVRNALLSMLVVLVLLGGVVLTSSALVVIGDQRQETLLSVSFVTGLTALGLFCVLGYLLNFNQLSLHYFYRDRLAETYLQTYAPAAGHDFSGPELPLRDDAEMPLTHLHGCRVDAGGQPLPDCVTASPLHLVVASLNLTSSRDMTRRDRKSDHFIFSKLFCGSDTTGYVPTAWYRSGRTKLARAMAISGAAASSAMGGETFFAEAFALTLFNARLGQWVENPRFRRGAWARWQERLVFWPFYLLREMLGSTDANRRLVHLSDGGHTGDNLGIVPLLKRRCAVIVACDAEADPDYSFGSLAEGLRQIYIDSNIKVDLVLTPMRPDHATGLSTRHCAVGRIRYPKEAGLPEEVGWLLVLKSSLTGDELARIDNYHQENPVFPQQSTADQFFDDNQFESYRELGYHVAKQSLLKVSETAWQPERGRDWERCWEEIQ